jgi:uncharacterized protein (UPF0548 family)
LFRLAKPSRETILNFIAAQRTEEFSYAEVGCSRGTAPTGYTADHNRLKLGEGLAVSEKAKAAIRQWQPFDIPWITLCWTDAPIAVGTAVAVLAAHLGFWSLNPCRIVYVLDEKQPVTRYGFAYGTLPQHAAIGEERFTVEFHPDDQSVWYDIYALSRPSFLARLAYPYTRVLQKRFATDSIAAMLRSVSTP